MSTVPSGRIDPRRVPMTRSAESGRLTKQSQTLKITRGWILAVRMEVVDDGVANCRTVCSFAAAMVEVSEIRLTAKRARVCSGEEILGLPMEAEEEEKSCVISH